MHPFSQQSGLSVPNTSGPGPAPEVAGSLPSPAVGPLLQPVPGLATSPVLGHGPTSEPGGAPGPLAASEPDGALMSTGAAEPAARVPDVEPHTPLVPEPLAVPVPAAVLHPGSIVLPDAAPTLEPRVGTVPDCEPARAVPARDTGPGTPSKDTEPVEVPFSSATGLADSCEESFRPRSTSTPVPSLTGSSRSRPPLEDSVRT